MLKLLPSPARWPGSRGRDVTLCTQERLKGSGFTGLEFTDLKSKNSGIQDVYTVYILYIPNSQIFKLHENRKVGGGGGGRGLMDLLLSEIVPLLRVCGISL